MAEYTGARHVFGVSSARAGLAVVFRALRRLSPERSVIAIPGYTCYSVAAAAVRAGLKIYPLEMVPEALDLDYQQMDNVPFDRLLGVVTANLFGYPSRAGQIGELSAGSGVWLIDDAAQSLGTCTDGQLSRSGSDVGLYSLARGKALPTGGGIIATDRQELADAIAGELESLPLPPLSQELKLYGELLAISVLFRPWLYWIPNALPFLNLGVTEFDPEFHLGRITRVSAGMLPGKLAQLREITASRSAKAVRLRQGLEDVRSFESPKPRSGCSPSYIRFPVLARDQQARDWALRELRKAGVGASGYYPAGICDIPGIERHLADGAVHRPGAEELSRRLLTLPLHPMVRDSDLDGMISVLQRYPA